MARVFSTKNSTIGYAIEADQASMVLFSKSHQNQITRVTFKAAGDSWIVSWLPKRFSMYAYSLGYYVSNAWRDLKKGLLGKAIPFVGFTPPGGGISKPPPRYKRSDKPLPTNPQKMMTATKGARAVGYAYGKAGSARVIISIPIGHAVQPNTIRAFTTIPELEIATMAGVAAKTFASLMDGAQVIEATKEGAPTRTLQGANLPIRPLGVTPRKSVAA